MIRARVKVGLVLRCRMMGLVLRVEFGAGVRVRGRGRG